MLNTWSAAIEFNSHGDIAVPSPRVKAEVSGLYCWAKAILYKAHTVAIGGEILHEEKGVGKYKLSDSWQTSAGWSALPNLEEIWFDFQR